MNTCQRHSVTSHYWENALCSKRCHFGSTNSPVTLYTSEPKIPFVLKHKFMESMDFNRETKTSKLEFGAKWGDFMPPEFFSS